MSSIDFFFSGRPFRLFFGVAAGAVLFASVSISISAQQTPRPAASPAVQGNGANANSVRTAAQPVLQGSQDQTAGELPSQPDLPELPKWPVNETPSKPSVTWDSHGLRIEANNASLRDILKEVSTDTGAKVEGLGNDERVFGDYGPGSARDVVSQLLHGSSYNVLMIGDQGEGTPRQIVLSARKPPGPASANRPTPNQPDEDYVPDEPQADEPIQPQQPPMINGRGPMMAPQGPPGAPRTPQQILQELQQRQQQMMEQQQQQQQQQQQ